MYSNKIFRPTKNYLIRHNERGVKMVTGQDKWVLINPEGTIQLETVSSRPRPKSLEEKTVLLRWNGKHNGDLFLNRIGELLVENVKDVKIVKAWEAIPETKIITSNANKSEELARKLSELKPDISIGAQGD